MTMTSLLRRALAACVCLPCLAWSACPPTTRIGLSDLGYASYRNGEAVEGISVDVGRELARRTGCPVEFVWLPRSRLFLELAAGHVDLTLGAIRSAERDSYASYLPYAYVKFDLVMTRRVAGHYESLADFAARSQARLNLTRGMQYGMELDTALSAFKDSGRLEIVNDFDAVFNKIRLGRADATLATPPIYMHHIKRLPHPTDIVVLPLSELRPQFIGLYASKKSVTAEQLQAYVGALKAMVAERSLPAIYGKYFDEAMVKEIFRLGPAPLAAALANPEAQPMRP